MAIARGDTSPYETPPIIGSDGDEAGIPEIVLFRSSVAADDGVCS
jgi:hypothetical protein